MGYIALKRLRWGDGWIDEGEPVPEGEPGRNYALMVEHGQIVEVADEAAGSDAGGQPARKPRARKRASSA